MRRRLDWEELLRVCSRLLDESTSFDCFSKFTTIK